MDSSSTAKCVIYQEHGSKKHQALIHQVHLVNKIVIHYADKSLGNKCFVYLFELYISKIPDAAKNKDLKPKLKFYADDEVWYYSSPVGHILLGC